MKTFVKVVDLKNGLVFLSALLSFVLACPAVVPANGDGHFYWTGAVDSDYTNPANWVWSANAVGPGADLPTTVPDVMPGLLTYDGNYNVHLHFPDSAKTKTVILAKHTKWGTEPKAHNVFFENASGYEIKGCNFGAVASVTATGEGTIATIKSSFQLGQATVDVSGGTLVFDFGMYFTGSGVLTLKGNGTWRVTNTLGGWSTERCVQIAGDATLRIDNATTFSPATKHVSLASAGAKYVFKGTAAGAQAKFNVSTPGSNGIINEYDSANSMLVARELDGDMAGYVEVSLLSPGTATLVRGDDGSFGVTAQNDFADSTMSVVAEDGTDEPIEISLGEGLTEAGTSVSASLEGVLAADKTYSLTFRSVQEAGTAEKPLGVIYTGVPVLTAVSPADEKTLEAGVVRVSRAEASPYPLTVNYDFSSLDAVAGVDFIAPTGIVTIPEGAADAEIRMMPIFNGAVMEDQTVTFALEPGDYRMSEAVTADIVIINSQEEMKENVWIAGEGSDNLASNPENWTKGVPTADSDVLLDGKFSNNPIIWDASEPVTVKSFLQTNYTGTVTFRTVYGDAGFTSFNVLGDCGVASGEWTHPANGTTANYRLNVTVGGAFSLGATAGINLYRKGYAANAHPEGGVIGLHAGGYGSVLTTCGDPAAPELLGAGGSSTPGGGAVKLTVAGPAVLDGFVCVNAGTNSNVWGGYSCGAAGSVWIKARSLAGAGLVDASAPAFNASEQGVASGGRIAIELTEATSLALPIANVTAYGTIARGNASSGAGTILVKTANQSYGTLYIKNRTRAESGTYGLMPPNLGGTTLIPANATWTVDAVFFSESGVLAVPPTAKLKLNGGFAAIGGDSYRAGLLALGGTIDAGAESPYVLQGGKWVFMADASAPYAFDHSVVVRGEAALGSLRFFSSVANPRVADITVRGDLMVESDGFLYVSGAGLTHIQNTSAYAGAYAHGGFPGIYGTDGTKVYGAALDPVLPGTYGCFNDTALQATGGGALKLTVTGELKMDGKGLAKACFDGYTPGGSGGSITIRAARLSGSGSFCLNGANAEQNASKIETVSQLEAEGSRAGAGGGRLAIRLTDPTATFPDGFVNRLTAYGGVFTFAGSHVTGTGPNAMSSAGTIYLQDGGAANEGKGTVYVKNNQGDTYNNHLAWTPFPALTRGDEVAALKKVSLDVSDSGRVSVSADLKLDRLALAQGTALNLNGKTLVVASARFNGVKLPPGDYAAVDYPDFLEDGEDACGQLQVTGGGFVIFVR